MSVISIVGVGLVGSYIIAILYGFTCLQCILFLYNTSKRRDSRWMRCTVWALWFLDTTHLVFTIHCMYWYTIIDRAVAAEGTNPVIPWGLPAGLLTTSLSDLIVRSWFTYRVWTLSKKDKLLTIPLVIASLVLFGTAFAFAVKSLAYTNLSEISSLSWLLYVNLGLAVVTDIYIAATLCFVLFRVRNRLNLRMYSVINVLMMYILNTGLATSFVYLGALVTFALMPHNFIYFGILFTVGNIYINSLLASFNAREYFKDDDISIKIPLTTGTGSYARTSYPPGRSIYSPQLPFHMPSPNTEKLLRDLKDVKLKDSK